MEKVTVHCYVDQLINNEDGKFDELDSAWLTVPKEWAEKQALKQGCESLEEFLNTYTYDNTIDWIYMAVVDGVLLGVGAGNMT